MSEADQVAAKIQKEIDDNKVPASRIHMFNYKGKKIADISTTEPFVMPKGSGEDEYVEKIISNGNFTANLNRARTAHVIYPEQGALGRPMSNGSLKILVKGNAKLDEVYRVVTLQTSGDAEIGKDAKAVIKDMDYGNGSSRNLGSIISAGNVIIHGKTGDPSLDGGTIKAKGWVKAEAVIANKLIESPELYLLEGQQAPGSYKGKPYIIKDKDWDKFTPPAITKVSPTGSDMDKAAAAFKKTIAAVGGNFSDSSEQVAIATTGNVGGSNEPRLG